jgi:two-component system, OmpR family, response regulator TctD
MTRTLRALVADDDLDDRTTICRVLVACGFDVDEADNGRQALELIRQTDYAMIVLDILMPQVDGFEVLKHLKTRDPEVLARTVVVSRLNLSDMKVFFPFCQLLEKPLDVKELETIARIVRNSANPLPEN